MNGETVADMRDRMEKNFNTRYQELTKTDDKLGAASPFRLILNACAQQLYQNAVYTDAMAKMQMLKYARGAYLDNLAALFRIKRKQAAYASVTMRFSTDGTRESVTAIPAGTRVATATGVQFYTATYTEILIGETHVDVQAICDTPGIVGNGFTAGTINVVVDGVPYISKVENITTSSGGAAQQSDEDLAYQVYLAPAGYSTAGPEQAYEFLARQSRADIGDARAYSPEAGKVRMIILMKDGTVPSEDICNFVRDYLSADARRPMTDLIEVAAPKEETYSIEMSYFIRRTDAARVSEIQDAVNNAVKNYSIWQRSVGRDINPSELIRCVLDAGAKRAEVKKPLFQAVSNLNIAKLDGQMVTYGGLEDD